MQVIRTDGPEPRRGAERGSTGGRRRGHLPDRRRLRARARLGGAARGGGARRRRRERRPDGGRTRLEQRNRRLAAHRRLPGGTQQRLGPDTCRLRPRTTWHAAPTCWPRCRSTSHIHWPPGRIATGARGSWRPATRSCSRSGRAWSTPPTDRGPSGAATTTTVAESQRFRSAHRAVGRREPVGFYAALVREGFRRGPAVGALICIAQVATATGRLREIVSPARSSRDGRLPRSREAAARAPRRTSSP